MPLEAIGTMMRRAREGRYAVGYFESWSLESLQGVVDAAEDARAPVILGFNGEFLSRDGRRAAERLSLYAAVGRAAAESASVPCALIFNECPRDDWTRAAIGLGFNLVMPVAGDDGPAEYARRVALLTRLAHDRGAGLEAELGELPNGASGESGALTDPDAAARFVAATGADLLAVSAGNVHVLLEGQKCLDLDRLAAIRERVPVPLVLHGGTGIAREALEGAIARGVAKVNFGTYLKQRYLDALRTGLLERRQNAGADPHRFAGLGGPEDILVAGRLAVRDAVLERIDWLGCRGRA